MFDDLLRTLNTFKDGAKIAVPVEVEADADGYIDRECPSEECRFAFKVHQDDWRDKVRNEEVFCPFCRHTAPARQWLTTEQVEWAKRAAIAKFKGMIGDAMRRDAQNWNRRQSRNAFLTITMNVKSSPQEVLLPMAATEPMRLKIICGACQSRYSVIGSAYFCPACGHNAADQMFEESLDRIRAALAAAPTIRASIGDADVAENTVRLLTENGLQHAVTAFQRFAEAIYSQSAHSAKPRKNVFQSINEGSRLWEEAFGTPFSAHLSADELQTLRRYFQQRHVLAHREGLVDREYVARSADTTYQPGQRLVIREGTVRDCLRLVEKLAGGLRQDAAPKSEAPP